jgi:hypothetical protein
MARDYKKIKASTWAQPNGLAESRGTGTLDICKRLSKE